MAGKALESLADVSPIAGIAGRALLKKARRMRRHTLPSAMTLKPVLPDFQNPVSGDEDCEDPAVAEVGFVRLVYKKARALRAQRDTPYSGLREVALDIMHAVRVCTQVRRFIALASAGCKALQNDVDVAPAPTREVLIRCMSRIPTMGDTVKKLNGEEVTDSEGGSAWVLKAGEYAVIKEVDEDGDLRLMNPSGETSKSWYYWYSSKRGFGYVPQVGSQE